MSDVPALSLRPLLHLTDDTGLQHGLRRGRGRGASYLTADNGRALALVSHLSADPLAQDLAEVYVAFLIHAYQGDGCFRPSMLPDGTWSDPVPGEVEHERACALALVGVATAGARAPWEQVRRVARALFDESSRFEADDHRALAYAAIAGAEMLAVDERSTMATRLVDLAASRLPRPRLSDHRWPWPDPVLGPLNAVLPDALLAIAHVTGDHTRADEAMALLRWLEVLETRDRHLSPVTGSEWSPGDPRPVFPQLPTDVWAHAAAAGRAHALTGQLRWAQAVRQAAAWFAGDNDAATPMWDRASSMARDVLGPKGPEGDHQADAALAAVGTSLELRRVTKRGDRRGDPTPAVRR